MSVIVYGKRINQNTTHLELYYKNITTIRGLDALVNLLVLNLSNNKITVIQGLNTLVNLQKLVLSDNNISKIQGLDALVNLQKLDLYNNKITTIQGLDKLLKLQILTLANNQITIIQGLDALVELKELWLYNNNISKIQGLDTLVNLQQLELSDNHITKIQGLDSLVKLQVLDLTNNQITKIQGLDALVNLQKLRLSKNKITEIRGLDTLVNLRYINLSNNQIRFIPNIPVINNLNLFEIDDNPILNITTPQRKALEKQVLRYRGQVKNKRLPPSKEATEWMNICRDLDQNYRLDELKNIARKAHIPLSIVGKPKNKRQLCVDLARQYDILENRPKHESGCDNNSDLMGNDFDTLDSHEYIRMPDGYCLSLTDLAGLAPDFIDPFKRGKLPQSVIEFYNKNKHRIRDASGVHELKPVGQAYKHQEVAMRLTNILNSTERKVDGIVIVVPGDTKYFDVGRLLVDKGTIDEYRRVIKRQKLIQDLRLMDYFTVGAPIVEYYDAMVDSLKRVKETRFDLLETLKWLYIEVMRRV